MGRERYNWDILGYIFDISVGSGDFNWDIFVRYIGGGGGVITGMFFVSR